MKYFKGQNPETIAASLGDGEMWEDPEFPASSESLGPVDKLPKVGWARPPEMVDGATLYKDGADAGDIHQGALGDCWFLAGLSVMASTKALALLSHVLSDSAKHADKGIYTFRFFKFGTWYQVAIDDQLPCIRGGPVFAKSDDTAEFWISLIEKAYAKLHGTYNDLSGGWVTDALVDMTGAIPQTLFLDEIEDKDALWDELFEEFSSGKYLMGAARSSAGGAHEVDDKNTGILAGHAYSILDMTVYQNHKLVRCRNPWGQTEWTGKWSDVDTFSWTEENKRALNHESSDDGTFYIEYSDFLENYNKIYLAVVVTDDMNHVGFDAEFKGSSAGGCVNHSSWVNNYQFQLQVFEDDTEVFVSAQQQDPRQKPIHNQEGNYMGVALLDGEPGEKTTDYLVVEQSKISGMRQAVVKAKLDKGTYNVMGFTFDAGKECPYRVDVWSEGEIGLVSLDGLEPAAGSAPPPSKPVPARDPSKPRKSKKPEGPASVSKIPFDDPGVVGKMLIMALKKMEGRYPLLKKLPTDRLAMMASGVGGKGCCTIM